MNFLPPPGHVSAIPAPAGDKCVCQHCGWAVEMRGGEVEERSEFLMRQVLEHMNDIHPEIVEARRA